jgi:pimeloyl-ACP methyl ester carboxylesterase
MTNLLVEGRQVSAEVTGSGEALVWIAGTGQPAAIWSRFQVPFFAGSHTNILIDLPGTGMSDPPGLPCTPASLASDVAHVVRDLGFDRATFVGLSLGSAVVQELALAEPALVAGAVLVSTWSCTKSERHLQYWFESRLRAHVAGDEGLFNSSSFWIWSQNLLEDEPERIAELARFVASVARPQPPESRVAHYDADLSHDTRDRLTGVSCPTIVICGADDFITLPRHNQTVSSLVPGAELHVIDGAGHMCLLERPDQVNALIDRFLSQVSRDKGGAL